MPWFPHFSRRAWAAEKTRSDELTNDAFRHGDFTALAGTHRGPGELDLAVQELIVLPSLLLALDKRTHQLAHDL